MRHSHGGGGPVAPLRAAALVECDVGASVHQRLVGVVVVGEQALLELALVMEDCLQRSRRQTEGVSISGSRKARFVV